MKGFFPLILAVMPGLILSGCSAKTTVEPLWIGHIAQLSGSRKAQGVQARLGVNLAVDETTTAGLRVMGRPLAVRHVDTRGEAETPRAEAVRLIAVSKVSALLVDVDSAQAERVGRESLPYGVPVLVCGELASPPGENVFVLGAGPEARGRALARCAAETLKADAVLVVIDGRNALAGAVAASFLKECRKIGKPKAEEVEYLTEEEFKERLSGVIKAKPQAVLLAGSVSDCQRLRSELLTAGLRPPVLFGGEDFGVIRLWRESDVRPDVYLATVFAAEGLKENEKGREFARRFQEAAGEPPTLAAALTYDGTRLLFEALRKAETDNGPRVREQLAKIEAFDSVTGSLSFKDHQAVRPVFVVRVQGNEAKVVKTFRSDE